MATKLRMHVGRHCFHVWWYKRREPRQLPRIMQVFTAAVPSWRRGSSRQGGLQLSTALARVVDPRVAAPDLGGAGWQRRKYASQRGRCLELNWLLPQGKNHSRRDHGIPEETRAPG